jgi:hypothetical protein
VVSTTTHICADESLGAAVWGVTEFTGSGVTTDALLSGVAREDRSSINLFGDERGRVTGPVLEVKPDLVVVQKGKGRWEIRPG